MGEAGHRTQPRPADDGARRSTFLANGPLAVRQARHFVGVALAEWDLKDAIEDAEICVSELVANAYRHGVGSSGVTWAARLTLTLDRTRLQIDVRDYGDSRSVPEVPAYSTDDLSDLRESGVGLRIVRALSDGWGWQRLADGKIVSCWFARIASERDHT